MTFPEILWHNRFYFLKKLQIYYQDQYQPIQWLRFIKSECKVMPHFNDYRIARKQTEERNLYKYKILSLFLKLCLMNSVTTPTNVVNLYGDWANILEDMTNRTIGSHQGQPKSAAAGKCWDGICFIRFDSSPMLGNMQQAYET